MNIHASFLFPTALCMCSGLAAAQSTNAFSLEKRLTINLSTAPTNTPKCLFNYNLRAKARVSGGCKDKNHLKEGDLNLPVQNFLYNNNPFPQLLEGDHNKTTALAQAFAEWGLDDPMNPLRYYILTHSAGTTHAESDTCSGNRKRAARAKAKAKSGVTITLPSADNADSISAMGLRTSWVNHKNEAKHHRRRSKVTQDPVVARLLDGNGVQLGEWEVIRVDSTVRGNGETSMTPDLVNASSCVMRLDNSAPDMELHVEIGSAVVDPLDYGVIDITVENNVITGRTLSGRFASIAGIPALNAASDAWTAQVDLGHVDLNLNAPPNVPMQLVCDLSGAVNSEPEGNVLGDTCSLVNELCRGFDGEDLSVLPAGDGTLSFSCLHGTQSLLETTSTEFNTGLDYLVVPYIIPGAPPELAPAAVYVRLYDGDPALGATPIYGGFGSPQTFEVEGADAYRVDPANKLDNSAYINEAIVDLSSAPVISANKTLWIEVSMVPPLGYTDVRVPPSPFADASLDRARSYSFSSGGFPTLQDATSGRSVCLPFELFGTPVETSIYCTAGTTSNGCVPAISATGTPSASSSSGFTISVVNLEGQKQGLLFYGINNTGFTAVPWSAGSTSFLCVKPPTQRTTPQNSGGTSSLCDGSLSLDWNAYIASNPTALGQPFVGGETVYAQAWFRDPPAVRTTNLSDALRFDVEP